MTTVRRYARGDAPTLCRLFFEAVHALNAADYSGEQLRAWAPRVPDARAWHERMSGRHTLVAEEGGEVLGFAELEGDGHLDMFYLRKDATGRGVGSRLYAALEERARDLGLGRLFTEASITARPFFGRHGFSVLGRNVVVRNGVELVNYRMEKILLRPGVGILGSFGQGEVKGLDVEALMKSDAGVGARLGIEFVELTPDRVVATMPVDGRHLQPFGYLHGGVSVVLAESVASVGGYLNCPPGKAAFGSEIGASHVRPKRGGSLTAVGTPAHRGRTSQVWEVRIADENDKTVCLSRCTVAVVDAGPSG